MSNPNRWRPSALRLAPERRTVSIPSGFGYRRGMTLDVGGEELIRVVRVDGGTLTVVRLRWWHVLADRMRSRVRRVRAWWLERFERDDEDD